MIAFEGWSENDCKEHTNVFPWIAMITCSSLPWGRSVMLLELAGS